MAIGSVVVVAFIQPSGSSRLPFHTPSDKANCPIAAQSRGVAHRYELHTGVPTASASQIADDTPSRASSCWRGRSAPCLSFAFSTAHSRVVEPDEYCCTVPTGWASFWAATKLAMSAWLYSISVIGVPRS